MAKLRKLSQPTLHPAQLALSRSICWVTALTILWTCTWPAMLAGADTTSNLDGHWTLDEMTGTSVLDATGNAPDGSNLGPATINQFGMVGTSYTFGGTSTGQKLDLNTSSVVPGTGEFSIFSFVKTSNTTTNQYVVNNYQAGQAGRTGFSVLNGDLSFFVNATSVVSPFDVADGQWHHVGVTRDAADNITFWLDGASTSGGSLATAIGGQGHDWYIGGRSDDNARNFAGSIDDVRVYSRTLGAADVAELAKPALFRAHYKLDETTGTAVVDSRQNFADGTNNGAAIGVPGIRDTAYSFDGVNDKLELNTNTLLPQSGDFSAFMWINSSENDSGQAYLLNNYVAGHSGRFAMQLADGEFGFFLNADAFSSDVNVNDGEWHHVGLSRDGNDYTFWIDGEAIDGPTLAGSIGIGDEWLLGGRVADNARQFAGLIDDLQIYHRVLTQEEVLALANIPEPSSVAVWIIAFVAVGFVCWRRRK